MKPPPQTQIDLDIIVARGCTSPGCTHKNHEGTLWLHPGCHPHGGLSVKYSKGGVLSLYCGVCEKPQAEILVAPMLDVSREIMVASDAMGLSDVVDSFDQEAFNAFVKKDGRHPELFLKWKLGKMSEQTFRREEADLVRDLVEKFRAQR